MTKSKLTVRVPPELSSKLCDMSKETGLTKNGLIVQAILDYVRKYREQKEKTA
nr:MAG TPA: antitoxin [Bacteriophage sp.]